jgi:hypothetical protein
MPVTLFETKTDTCTIIHRCSDAVLCGWMDGARIVDPLMLQAPKRGLTIRAPLGTLMQSNTLHLPRKPRQRRSRSYRAQC